MMNVIKTKGCIIISTLSVIMMNVVKTKGCIFISTVSVIMMNVVTPNVEAPEKIIISPTSLDLKFLSRNFKKSEFQNLRKKWNLLVKLEICSQD